MNKISPELKEILLKFQRNEITEHEVYLKLKERVKGKNAEVLEKIASDELRHYKTWKEFTGQDVSPKRWVVFLYSIVHRIMGLTFTVKMLERTEKGAEEEYSKIASALPQAKEVLEDELNHEKMLLNMIDEERINYIGSMVLGLNDALVELTGALAGLSFALQNTRMIAIAGLITGIAASLSMAASEYLSTKSEGDKNPLKAAFYTGIAYVFTVVVLVLPFFLWKAYYFALATTLVAVLGIIFLFTFFLAVVKDMSFKKTFAEMALLSISVAAISFLIGIVVRKVFHIEI